VYRNPYHGYSDTEYGHHQEQDLGTEHVYGHQVHGVEQVHPHSIRQGGQTPGNYSDGTFRVQKTTQLLQSTSKHERWPGQLDFLSSTLAFSLSFHSLWSLPIVIVQHGGLVFLLIYIFLLGVLGAPLLLLEMFLGQYSGLTVASLYKHLSPILGGLGVAICIQSVVRSMMELGVLMWIGQGMFKLFYHQKIEEEFFAKDILNKEDASLEDLGSLSTQLLLVLGIVTLSVFVLVAAGTKSVGKVCLVTSPLCFMIIVTLVIRACLATGGPQGVLMFLQPTWSLVKEPTIWLEAASQVIFSLQLGLGVITSYSQYNKYQHNIIRDCTTLVVAHLVWVLLAILLTFSLLGVAVSADKIKLTEGSQVIVSITGHSLWLAAETLIAKSLVTISHGWLWAGLYFILLFLVGVSSFFGYLEVITSSLAGIKPSLRKFKPIIAFFTLCLLFLTDIILATQGGIHVYHYLLTYIYTWPSLLFSLLAVLAVSLSHGTNYFMKDLCHMSKLSLPHCIISHLSVIYTTILPTFLIGSLVWTLYLLSLDHLEDPLATFDLSVPHTWLLYLGWSLSCLPVLPVVLGVVIRLVWVTRGVPCIMHMRSSTLATYTWYRNEQRNNKTERQ